MFRWSDFDETGSSDKFWHELENKEFPKGFSPLLSLWFTLSWEPQDMTVEIAAAAFSWTVTTWHHLRMDSVTVSSKHFSTENQSTVFWLSHCKLYYGWNDRWFLVTQTYTDN